MKVKTNIIGAQVMQMRQAQGMTRQDLLDRLQAHGVTMSMRTLSLLERRQRRVTDIEVDALARALDVLPSSLMERGTQF